MESATKPLPKNRFSTVNQQVIDSLFCTEKGKLMLKANEASLTIRERQFLRLLSNDDYISRRACSRIISKISLQSLIDAGLIAQNTAQSTDENKTPSAEQATRSSQMTGLMASYNLDSDIKQPKASAKNKPSRQPTSQLSSFETAQQTLPRPSSIIQVVAGVYCYSKHKNKGL